MKFPCDRLGFRTLRFVFSFGFLSVACVSSALAADPVLDQGKAIYNGTGACFSCHGPLGLGDGAAAAALNPKPRSFADAQYLYDTDGDKKTGTETDIFNIITNGAQKYGGNMMMVARPDIPEADRKALVKYVLSLKK